MSKKPKNKVKQVKDNTTRNITIGMVLLVLATGVFFSIYSKNIDSKVAYPKSATVGKVSPITFNNDVTDKVIDIWEDPQCPVCMKFETVVGDYVNELIDSKKAQVRYHVLSFLGPESAALANALACSADDGKFRDFHSFLYKNQRPENSGFWNSENIKIAYSSISTSKEFISCVDENKYANYVSKVAADGMKEKVNSTPTVFVNGNEINRNTDYFNIEAFKKVTS